ncbi:hypothetical protein [Nostoc sp.]|uniref:hypothetical protein n=1 Tax=Nostoc sp. TaxID=1180 RepID=UPI002FFC96E5
MAENLAQQIIEAARRLPRKVYLPNPDADKLAEDPFPALQTWLTEIEPSNRGQRFLLCLDEYERLDEVVKATSSRAPSRIPDVVVLPTQQWEALSNPEAVIELNETPPILVVEVVSESTQTQTTAASFLSMLFSKFLNTGLLTLFKR